MLQGTAIRLRNTAQLARQLAPIAATPRARAHLLVTTFRLALRRFASLRGGHWVELRLAHAGVRFPFVVSTLEDLQALATVLAGDEYAVELPADPAVILDLGSHVGASIAFFRLRYPRARIVGLEPDPETFAKLEQNVAALGAEVRRMAVAPRDGRAAFFVAASNQASSLRDGPQRSVPIEVDTRSLDTLLTELGVQTLDLVKIDVEGAELEVLRAFQRLDRVGAIVGELHPRMVAGTREDFLALLDKFEVATRTDGPDSITFTAVRHPPRG